MVCMRMREQSIYQSEKEKEKVSRGLEILLIATIMILIGHDTANRRYLLEFVFQFLDFLIFILLLYLSTAQVR